MRCKAIINYLSLLLSLALLVNPQPLWASLAVAPLKQEISIRPGETAKITLRFIHQVRAAEVTPDVATLTLTDVSVSEAGSLIFKDPGTLKNSASPWITLPTKTVSVDPGKEDTVEIAIAPPLQTPPGEYYSAVKVDLGQVTRTEVGIQLKYQIVSGIFVTVLGQTLSKQAKIVGSDIRWPSQFAAPATQPATTQPAATAPPVVMVTLQNSGPARFTASGTVRIVDAESRRVLMTAVLVSGRPCVFGGDRRLFEAPITKPLPPGKYQAKITLDYESSWNRAYYTEVFEISPEQALMLAQVVKHQADTTTGISIRPAKYSLAIPAGGSRSLGLALKSTTEIPVRCLVSGASTGAGDMDSWFTIDPADSTLKNFGHKSVEIKIEVPHDAKPGPYTALVAIESHPEGSDLHRTEVPIEIQVKPER